VTVQEDVDDGRFLSRSSHRRNLRDAQRQLSTLALDRLTFAGGLAGILGVAPFFPVALRVVLVGMFAMCAPGGLVAGSLKALPRMVAAIAIPATGLAVLALLLSAELALGQFHPVATTAVIAVVAVIRAVLSARGSLIPSRAPATIGAAHLTTGAWASLGLSAAAVVLFGLSVAPAAAADYTSYGLLFAVPSVLIGALVALMAFVVALRCASAGAAWLAAATLVLVLRGYSLFATPQAVYFYTYRHLGVMDWFAHSGTLARGVDVYSDWPGALATGSWFSQSSGVSTFAMAHGFILIYHFVLLYAVFVLARAARLPTYVALTAAVVVEALNWVGQDYLSPQAFAFLLAIVVLTLVLTARDERHTRSAAVLAVVIFTAITWSHQLTPVWLLVIVVTMGVLNTARPPWLAAPMVLSFAVMVAVNWASLLANNPGISADVAKNSEGNVAQIGAAGQQFTSELTRGVAIALWLSVLLLVVVQLLRRKLATAPIILFCSSAVVLLSNYGGEAVFRVYLYSLPGAAILLAPALTSALTARFSTVRGAVLPMASALGALVVFAGAMQCTFGGWFTGRVSTRAVAVEGRLERAAGEKGQIAAVSLGFPQQMTWRYVPQVESSTVLRNPLYGITDLYQGSDGSNPTYVDALVYAVKTRTPDLPVYVIVKSPLLLTQQNQLGLMKPGSLDRIASHFQRDGWQAIPSTGGVLVYTNAAGARSWRASG